MATSPAGPHVSTLKGLSEFSGSADERRLMLFANAQYFDLEFFFSPPLCWLRWSIIGQERSVIAPGYFKSSVRSALWDVSAAVLRRTLRRQIEEGLILSACLAKTD